jgi:hypothetical protein
MKVPGHQPRRAAPQPSLKSLEAKALNTLDKAKAKVDQAITSLEALVPDAKPQLEKIRGQVDGKFSLERAGLALKLDAALESGTAAAIPAPVDTQVKSARKGKTSIGRTAPKKTHHGHKTHGQTAPHKTHGKTHAHKTHVSAPTGGSVAGGKRVTAYVNGHAQSITVVPVGNGQFMRADAAAAFKRMEAGARAAGINLSATSGFRSMAQQEELYRKFLNGTGNLAARPGFSNHQNGIAMDIGGIGGRGTQADHWLRANAARYGFRNLPSEFWHYDFVR